LIFHRIDENLRDFRAGELDGRDFAVGEHFADFCAGQ